VSGPAHRTSRPPPTAVWLHEMTGTCWTSSTEAQLPGALPAISIGRTDLLIQANLPAATVDLGEEGYASPSKTATCSFGEAAPRGINAVYALLEETSAALVHPKPLAIPYQPTLILSPVERTSLPAARLRDPFYYVAFNEDVVAT